MNDPKRIIIVILGLVPLIILAFMIKRYMDSGGYATYVNYTTAVQVTTQDDFNYAVDSQQGRVLANGNFTVLPKNAVKFAEMTKAFTYVKRIEEHYTMHTYTTCSKRSCTTHVYYSWDETGEDEKEASIISFMGGNYSTNLFNFDNFLSNNINDYYIDPVDRYTYSTVPLTFNATFLATTYGGLKPFNEDSITLENETIQQVLQDKGQYGFIDFWVLITLLTGILVGGGFLAYYWVMQDGEWSTHE